MPITNFSRGDRVLIKLNSSYRYYLDGLYGTITGVLHHGAIVSLDSDPAEVQKAIGAGGVAGPKIPPPRQRIFQFNEIEKVP